MGSLRRLPLTSVVNCRDLGGYYCSGKVTQYGRFLRCGIPGIPPKQDIVKLLHYGVNTVIDLRGQYEKEMTPSVFSYLNGVDYHNICLFELNAAVDTDPDMTIERSYQISIENYKENYAEVLNTIANAEDGCILFHCYFGKDRTGMLSALLLDIAGVAVEDIIADYQVSYTYLLPFIRRERANKKSIILETDEANLKSEPNTIASFLYYINQNYGSVEGYLKSIGVTDETIEKIRNRFFD